MSSKESTQKTSTGKIRTAYEKAMDRLEENSPKQPTETEEKPADDSNASESESAPEEQAKVEVIVEEEVEEKAINIDYKDKYARSCAEFENFRMRVKRDKESWRSSAIHSMALSFIDILDNLNLALTATKQNETQNDKSFLKGVTAVRDQFKNQLEQRGVRQIEVKSGDSFDADLHEILLVQESADVDGQVVGAILRPGYKLDKNVLRAAQIQVLKGNMS
jgi:molecular chaperone GrpE